MDHFHRTGTNAVTNRATFRHDFALRVEGITLHHLAAGANRFRARLDDEQLAGVIYAPTQEHGKQVKIEDVPQELRDRFSLTDAEVQELAKQAVQIEKHYGAVVFFNLHRLLRQLLHFGVGQGEAVAQLLRYIFNLHLLAMLLGRGIDHTGKLFIVQARPETVRSRGQVMERYTLHAQGKIVAEGRAIGHRIGAGPVKVIHDISEMNQASVCGRRIRQGSRPPAPPSHPGPTRR